MSWEDACGPTNAPERSGSGGKTILFEAPGSSRLLFALCRDQDQDQESVALAIDATRLLVRESIDFVRPPCVNSTGTLGTNDVPTTTSNTASKSPMLTNMSQKPTLPPVVNTRRNGQEQNQDGVDAMMDGPMFASEDDAGSGGAIAGAVIGVLCCCVLVFLLLAFLWRRRNEEKEEGNYSPTSSQYGNVPHGEEVQAFSDGDVAQFRQSELERAMGEESGRQAAQSLQSSDGSMSNFPTLKSTPSQYQNLTLIPKRDDDAANSRHYGLPHSTLQK